MTPFAIGNHHSDYNNGKDLETRGDSRGFEIVGGEIHKIWRMRKRGQRFPEFLSSLHD